MCDDSEQDIKPRTVPSKVTSDVPRIETRHCTKERNKHRNKKRNKQCTKQRKNFGGRSPLKKNKREESKKRSLLWSVRFLVRFSERPHTIKLSHFDLPTLFLIRSPMSCLSRITTVCGQLKKVPKP